MHEPLVPSPLRRFVSGLLGALLLAHSLWLMGQGRLHLGVVLPALVAAGLLAWALWGRRWGAWLALRPRWRCAWRWVRRGLLLWFVSLLAFWAWLAWGAHGAGQGAAPQAIVVLGSGTPGCAPSATLQARLDVALQQARQYPGALVLLSGGANWAGTCTEAGVMAAALQAAGLPASRLLQEERSTSTDENLRFSATLLAARGVPASAPVRIITSDFHLPRALAIARRAGYAQASGLGAPTPLATRYNAWLREYFAWGSGWVLGEY